MVKAGKRRHSKKGNQKAAVPMIGGKRDRCLGG